MKKMVLCLSIMLIMYTCAACSANSPLPEASNEIEQTEQMPTASPAISEEGDKAVPLLSWGHSIDEIKAEMAVDPQDTSDDALLYDGVMFGVYCPFYCLFDNDHGMFQVYGFIEFDDQNKENCFATYNSAKEGISEQFGLPTNDDVISANPPETVSPENANAALLVGDAFFSATWESSDTRIELFMTQGGEGVLMSITAHDANYDYLANTQ